MNLGTISLILGSVASIFAILAYLYKGIRYNKARSKAQQGRITALFQITKIQGERLTAMESCLTTTDVGNYQINTALIELEKEAFAEFKTHNTHLT